MLSKKNVDEHSIYYELSNSLKHGIGCYTCIEKFFRGTLFYYAFLYGVSDVLSRDRKITPSDFYILSETRMLRNDYFMFFFKTVVCNSPSKTVQQFLHGGK